MMGRRNAAREVFYHAYDSSTDSSRSGSGLADGPLAFPGLGGAPPGDLNITVAVTPHEALRRDAFDVRMDLEISAARMRDDDRVRVPTIGGEMAVEIPAGAEPGQVLRLRGMGIRDRVSGGRGDQYVHLVPDRP